MSLGSKKNLSLVLPHKIEEKMVCCNQLKKGKEEAKDVATQSVAASFARKRDQTFCCI